MEILQRRNVLINWLIAAKHVILNSYLDLITGSVVIVPITESKLEILSYEVKNSKEVCSTKFLKSLKVKK